MTQQRECIHCHGIGECLARLTRDQDFGFAKRGKPIPKVKCWVCNGTGKIAVDTEIARDSK